jgi:murein L,D-transpeptidase YafK
MRSLSFLFLAGCISGPATAEAVEGPGSLREAAVHAGIGWPPPDADVVVEKRQRTLHVRSRGEVLVSWNIGLGGTEADKVREGDMATPEGVFRVVTRNPNSRFHRFLGLSYPNAEDADRGLRDGLIRLAEANAIREADRAGRQPPWNTALGGAVGLHGGGGSTDWTHGCVALENSQIDELWDVLPVGARVEIRP